MILRLGSLFSRLNLPTNFSGLQAFGSALGYRSYVGSRLSWQTRPANAIPLLSHFGDKLSYDPAKLEAYWQELQSTKPGYYSIPIADTFRDGHPYSYLSEPYALSAEAQAAIRQKKGGGVGLMVLAFAAGDSYLKRPADLMSKYPSDFAYTVAMYKAGTIPKDALVQLASSQIRLGEPQVGQGDGHLAVTSLAETTDAHFLGPDGQARWFYVLDSEGKLRVQYHGSGKLTVCGTDAANSAIGGPLWHTTAEKIAVLAEALGKNPAFLDDVHNTSELRAKISEQLSLRNRNTEFFLRIMDTATRPYIWLREKFADCFAGEPRPTTPSSTATINDVVSKPDLTGDDLIDEDERNSLKSDATELQSSGRKPEPLNPQHYSMFDSSGNGESLPDSSDDSSQGQDQSGHDPGPDPSYPPDPDRPGDPINAGEDER